MSDSFAIKLVVGLGNPGSSYELTRHNVGFWCVDAIANLHTISFEHNKKLKSLTALKSYWLAKPTTFMNLSGQAVSALCQFYKIKPSELLVIHDDLDLPPGRSKLKKGGGTGGHNGLKSIQNQLGTPDYWRIRIGIGHPGHRSAVSGWVLSKPNTNDQQAIEKSIQRITTIWPAIEKSDFDQAMQTLNTHNFS